MHRLCLTGILFLVLVIFWIPSLYVPTLLRSIYSLGIIRFWWQRGMANKWRFFHVEAYKNTI